MRLLGRRAECEFLDTLLADARAGRSRVVAVRGDAGVGKSSLLNFLEDRATGWRVAKAAGSESETELAYSGLHQMCAPMLDQIARLPVPQRIALSTVFGYESGPPPDRFLVGLATLTLLAEVADQRPLLCLIDDAQWLDEASAQIILFVARRLLADRIALVCAARSRVGDQILDGLPTMEVDGLGDSDARALLLENLHGPMDAAVCEQLLKESRGNPLALLELPRTWNVAEVAGGFGLPLHQPIASKIEQSFATRLRQLPGDTQLLLLAAAAEPVGDPHVLRRAVEQLGVEMMAAGPAVDAGLFVTSSRIEFAHPLVRSAAYESATTTQRRRVHAALADATDPDGDPDRRAWHRARATATPDENVAADLERSADRAQARGGVSAAAAFLERAATLSSDAESQARRSLAAAEAKQLAGDPQAALRLLTAAAAGPLNERGRALALRLNGMIALDMRRGGEAVPLLLDAATQIESAEPDLARKTYLDAFYAASFYSTGMLRRAAQAARRATRPQGTATADDLMLTALSVRFTDGYAAAAQPLKHALHAYREQDLATVEDARWPGIARRIAPDLFDDDSWQDLAARSVQLARERGALGALPLALSNLAVLRTFEGDLGAAAALVEESDAIADLAGVNRISFGGLILAAFRGDETAVSDHIAADNISAAAEELRVVVGDHARSVLNNGFGRYEAALSAAENGTKSGALNQTVWSLPELVEAATRCGNNALAATALERLVERTQASSTEWALGIEARTRALLSEGPTAEQLYQEASDRLSRCRIATEQARTELLYGEWLRRQGRRVDAREHLRVAHHRLAEMGMTSFAERARRELSATGEKVRRHQPEARDELTAQEAQIAQMARTGHSNPEIAAQLFLSPRTVEWHMRKVFAKLGISSRRELDAALPEGDEAERGERHASA